MDIEELLPHTRTPRDYLDLVADPRLDRDALRVLARSPYSFVRRAVAQDPRTDAVALTELLVGEFDTWEHNCLLRLVAQHPRADRAVLLTVLTDTADLLNQPDARPYAAAIALAGRPELEPHEVRLVQRQPGASRRMRRGVERALARRPRPRPTG
ncbi:hypothetical protein Athai_65390 [Actinocatenispora thailandica]|uniref:HEAT repeat domain-containing protein n=1 Tax=Actinocatenispora thailandica TaxID=227318 RepID=A0A7R7I0W7_9ACTN|nr:hypothetical protein [Actinocatenispora thailandica]BCJ39036.1 hypothetical protein Athai_65390 [Actinocatenispora thailandica]